VPEQVPHVRVLLLHVRIPRRFHGLPAPANSRKCRQQQEISLSLPVDRKENRREEREGGKLGFLVLENAACSAARTCKGREDSRERERTGEVCATVWVVGVSVRLTVGPRGDFCVCVLCVSDCVRE
jgi:hypothetical protein